MLKVKAREKVLYKAFGFSITSEIPFTELKQMSGFGDSVDIEITYANLAIGCLELSNRGDFFVTSKEGDVLFQIPNIATFAVEEGKRIIISPLTDYDEDVARLWILGTCMGIILMQRKIFPLHGSAIAIDGKAYAIVGESGAGKSTLASSFLNKGYQLLSDDVIAVSLQENEQVPFVIPSYPQQKLWQDSLAFLGMETNQYRSVFGRETKYCVPLTTTFFTHPLPLAGIFELTRNDNEEVYLNSIGKLESFYILFYHTYRNFLIDRLGLMDWHFQTSSRLLNQINTYRLQRPVSRFSANELVSTILNTINEGG